MNCFNSLSYKQWSVVIGVLAATAHLSNAFTMPTRKVPGWRPSVFPLKSTVGASLSYNPLFDFSEPDTCDKFDRIDDVIMGGISSSSLSSTNSSYAKWFGICRTDGGGFCGMRTLPFDTPLNVSDAEGFYLKCRLASDDEWDRRVWKVSTRIKPDRGEQVYQARYKFSRPEKDGWSTVLVPFDDFRLVRGPRMVPGAPPLNVTGGLYQIGLTLSKFDMGSNVTEMENFREGFFEMQLKEMGTFTSKSIADEAKVIGIEQKGLPRVLSKLEADKKRPILLKALFFVGQFFFSEKLQRRKSALRILREKRNFSRSQAILFGLKNKAKSFGWFSSIVRTSTMLTSDVLRVAFFLLLKVVVVLPFRLVKRITSVTKRK